MIGGYMGKILFVDLSQGKTWNEPLEEKLCRDFIGGYGLGAKIIFDRQRPKVDPLGPDAILGFITGPCTGTPAIIGSRYVVVGKSPLTGTWGDANSGGDFGPHLKFAGYDAVFFRGISDRPVYLFIDDGKAELRKADHLWGKDSHETEDILKAELGEEVRVACIGPSGEKLSLISCVINNKGRAAGRSGLGALMGSKKLKAIAVKGKQAVPLANKSELDAARKKYLEQIKNSPIAQAFSQAGTTGLMSFFNMIGEVPIKNWSGVPSVDLPDVTPFDGQTVNNLQEKKFGCWRCPISCGGLMKAGMGQYKYPAGVHRPEYETVVTFGNMCLNNDLESTIMAADICNRYGLDTISAGCAIAFAIECYENGLITDKDTGGIQLRWGNHEAIIAMTEKMARREGFGDVLADGVRAAAKKIGKGAEKFAIHIHGEEVPMHDPKAVRAVDYAPTYLLDATPARHTQYSVPISGLELPPFDPMSFAGRGEAVKITRNLQHVNQCAGLCMFGYVSLDANALPDFLNLVTGWNLSIDDLLKIGERIANIRHAFNIREGITLNDLKMPDRVLGRPPFEAGPTAGRQIDMETLAKDYLAAMDWDPNTGKPSRKKLLELGLEDVAKALWPR